MYKITHIASISLMMLFILFCDNGLAASIPSSIKDKPIKYKCVEGVCETSITTYDMFNVMTDNSKRSRDKNNSVEITKGTAGKLDVIINQRSKLTKVTFHMDNNYVISKISVKIGSQSKVFNDPKEITDMLILYGAKPREKEPEKESSLPKEPISLFAGIAWTDDIFNVQKKLNAVPGIEEIDGFTSLFGTLDDKAVNSIKDDLADCRSRNSSRIITAKTIMLAGVPYELKIEYHCWRQIGQIPKMVLVGKSTSESHNKTIMDMFKAKYSNYTIHSDKSESWNQPYFVGRNSNFKYISELTIEDRYKNKIDIIASDYNLEINYLKSDKYDNQLKDMEEEQKKKEELKERELELNKFKNVPDAGSAL